MERFPSTIHREFIGVCDIGGKAKVERTEMDDSLIIRAATAQITPSTVIALVTVSALFVIGLLVLIGILVRRTDKPLEHGGFFVVTLGIATALMGFLVAFPLIISGVFTDPTQVLAILSALFGTIVGLVGTYFGVKASSDAREGAQKLAAASGRVVSRPLVLSTNPQDRAEGVPPDTHPTATFSKDMDRVTINPTTFKLLDQDELEPVAGGVDYDVPTRVATFTPAAALENGRIYEATITAGVKDQAGNALAQDHTWHFKVIGEGE
jgi:hypothetical protein